MNLALTLPLAAGAVVLAAVSLAGRRPFSGAIALAGMGAVVAALLAAEGFAGLAVAALAAVWGVAAAGLVVGRRLSEVEAQESAAPARGPWVLALIASAILALSLMLGVLVVDWPGARLAVSSAQGAGTAGVGADRDAARLCEWALAALGAAAALVLAAFAPRTKEE